MRFDIWLRFDSEFDFDSVIIHRVVEDVNFLVAAIGFELVIHHVVEDSNLLVVYSARDRKVASNNRIWYDTLFRIGTTS